MSLDRQTIERRDFPIARRGYDIDAVNEHLALLADEYEASGRAGRPSKAGSVASNAAEQVRVIVEVAEQTAAEITREAELESRQLLQDAREEAERLRTDAGQEARAHVATVAEVAQALLDRVEGMDRELGTVLDGLRSGVRRVTADLVLLQGAVGEFRAAGAGPGGRTPASSDQSLPAANQPPRMPAAPNGDADRAHAAVDGEDNLQLEEDIQAGSVERRGGEAGTSRPEPRPRAAGDASRSNPFDDDEGVRDPVTSEEERARMIALNMALNGVPREETQRHLEDNFDVADVESVLDDAYMRAGQ